MILTYLKIPSLQAEWIIFRVCLVLSIPLGGLTKQATLTLVCGKTCLFKRNVSKNKRTPSLVNYAGFTEEESQAWLGNFRL